MSCDHMLRLKVRFPVCLPAVTQAFVQPCLWLWKPNSFIFVFDFVCSRFLPFPLSYPSLYLSPSPAVFFLQSFHVPSLLPFVSGLIQSVLSSWDCICFHLSLHHSSTRSLVFFPQRTRECLLNEMHVAACMHHEHVCVCLCITLCVSEAAAGFNSRTTV